MSRFARWTPLLLAVALSLAGVAAIHSAGGGSEGRALGAFARSQLVWLALAIPAGFVIARIPFGWLERRAGLAYGLALMSLLGLFAVGELANGARSWYRFGPVRVQPAEAAKLALVLALASACANRGGPGASGAQALWRAGFVTAPFFLLIAAQPDLGTAAVLVPPAVVVALVAGAPLGPFVLAAVLGAGAASAFAFGGGLETHQIERLETFLDPDLDPLGKGFQAIQAKLAIGGGGVFGQGFGLGSQTQLGFLPDRHTDFIFAVICEEWGLVGGALLLLGYLAIVLAALAVAWRARDGSARLLAAGVAALIGTQVLVNAGMTIGLVPVTGVTLPFVSYGGSSLVTSFALLGLLVSAAAHRPIRLAAIGLHDPHVIPPAHRDRARGLRLS